MNKLYEVGGKTIYRRSISAPDNTSAALIAVQLSRYHGVLILWEQHRVPNDDSAFDAPAFLYDWSLVEVYNTHDKDRAIEDAVDRALKSDPGVESSAGEPLK